MFKDELLGDALVVAFALPFIISAGILVLLWRPWRTSLVRPAGEWRGALALAIGLLTIHVYVFGLPAFPPAESIDKLFYVVLIALGYGVIDEPRRVPGRMRWFSRFCLAASVVIFLLQPQLKIAGWSTVESAAWLGGLALAVFAEWSAVDGLLARSKPSALIVLAGMSLGTAAVASVSASVKLELLAYALAGSLVAYIPLRALRRGQLLDRGAVVLVMLATACIWIIGYFFCEVPASCLIALAITPWPLLLMEARLRRPTGWRRRVVALLLVSAPVAVACYLAIEQYIWTIIRPVLEGSPGK
jgi:hypothetical protein